MKLPINIVQSIFFGHFGIKLYQENVDVPIKWNTGTQEGQKSQNFFNKDLQTINVQTVPDTNDPLL